MSKLFVFAIGGTGERVMRSFTMLLAAGVPSFNNYDVYPIMIDYDAKSGDKTRAMDILKRYSEIHQAAFTSHPPTGNQFFGTKVVQLAGLDNFVLTYQPKDEQKKYRERIGFSSLTRETYNTHHLLHSLYDDSNDETTELNLDMTVGFKGNPNIGSVVFHKIQEKQEYKNFLTLYNAANGDKVVVIGSLFGGTGASGIPELIYALKKDKPNAQIAAILMLPYFAPARQDGGAINAKLFNAKTKAALNYYHDCGLKDQLNSIYYLGDPLPTVVKYCDGGENQHNKANLVELLAAMSIDHFVSLNDTYNDKEYKFSLDVDMQSRRLYIGDFAGTGVDERIFKPLTSFALMLKYFKGSIIPGLRNVSYYDILGLPNMKRTERSDFSSSNRVQDLCACLNEYYSKFVEWIAELDFEGDENNGIPANSHRLATYSLEREYNKMIVVPEESGTTNRRLSADFISARLNDALDNHYKNRKWNTNEKEYVFMDILHRAAEEAVKQI